MEPQTQPSLQPLVPLPNLSSGPMAPAPQPIPVAPPQPIARLPQPPVRQPEPTLDPIEPAPVAAARVPRSPLIPIILGVVIVALLAIGGWYIWGAIGPQSVGTTPITSPSQDTDMFPSDEDAVACTMDAQQCPDGSYVGRTGPNCEFVCPDATSGVTGSESTKGGMPAEIPAMETTTGAGTTTISTATADWDTYKNPAFNVSFRYPAGWEVRDQKPYPRTDIQFRHAFGPIKNFQAQGYLEVSTLPVLELVEQLKVDGSTVADLPDGRLGTNTVVKRTKTKAGASTEHWFIRVGERTYHITASGTAPEVAQIAQSLLIQ